MTRRHLDQSLRASLCPSLMAGPIVIASTANLVIARCRAGISGAMPALNPCTTADLDADIARIVAAYAINPVAQASNSRLAADPAVVLHHADARRAMGLA